jgi:3-methyladenine DNA glycosylase AlkD
VRYRDTPGAAAVTARRALKRMARSPGHFDASRYFRGAADLGFYNVGTGAIRALARSIHAAHVQEWSIEDAVSFAGALIVDRFLEVKSVGVEVMARYRRDFTPRLLPVWKRWLADGHAANWATTDAICGSLVGPLLAMSPALADRMRAWARHRSMWVRRGSAVSLIPSVRTGRSLDVAYAVARSLHADQEDLIQKAVGWLLREVGKVNPSRLERYLRQNGAAIPRTTVRYAIERLPPAKRLAMLEITARLRRNQSGQPIRARGGPEGRPDRREEKADGR